VDEKIYRSSLLRERLQELITQGTLLIDTAGTCVGQVNGLSVVRMGDYDFGHPIRITASVGPGRGDIIDIEREVALGPLHSKGVLILSGYLCAGQFYIWAITTIGEGIELLTGCRPARAGLMGTSQMAL
jgi:predicted ATP-dependent protease